MNQEILKSKQAIVDEVTAAAKAANSIVIVEYRGLTVAQLTDLRKNLRKIGATLSVYKNSLVGRALSSLGVKDLGSALEGPNAFVFSKDTVAGPKAVISFAKRNEHLVVKGGVIEGKAASAADVKTVSMLPGREGLISMFLSCLQSPISSFARTVQAVADKQN